MTLQSRVAPDGTLHATSARGTLMGNRGIIHDPATRRLSGRRWTTRAWIACELCFRGRARKVWGRGWTELFFLDEVTALAAGHRPCFECRRAEAQAFARALGAVEGRPLRAPDLDRRLAPDRLGGDAPTRPMPAADLGSLPDGAVVHQGAAFWALRAGRTLRWSFGGYLPDAPPRGEVALVTPGAVLAALRWGYVPRWHPSAA